MLFCFIGALHYNILHIVIDGKSSKTCCLFNHVFNCSNDLKQLVLPGIFFKIVVMPGKHKIFLRLFF